MADKPVMDHNSLANRLLEWKADMMRTIDAGADDPNAARYPEWYAGLAVSPASFSRQLGSMQVAMLRANGLRVNGVLREAGMPAARTSGIR